MERLTKRINGIVTYIGKENSSDIGQTAAELNVAACREILKRLADYEDTKLSPQACVEAREIDEGFSANDYSIHRMVELMRADKDGRIVMLPHCKLGDTVYWLHDKKITECRVYRIQESKKGVQIAIKSIVSHGVFSVDEYFGKTIFLTYEDAKKALEG